jgi:hypothetical protein
MRRDRQIDIVRGPLGSKEVDSFEAVHPGQIELRNIRRTATGAWRRRPGLKKTFLIRDEGFSTLPGQTAPGLNLATAETFISRLFGAVDQMYAITSRGAVHRVGQLGQTSLPEESSADPWLPGELYGVGDIVYFYNPSWYPGVAEWRCITEHTGITSLIPGYPFSDSWMNYWVPLDGTTGRLIGHIDFLDTKTKPQVVFSQGRGYITAGGHLWTMSGETLARTTLDSPGEETPPVPFLKDIEGGGLEDGDYVYAIRKILRSQSFGNLGEPSRVVRVGEGSKRGILLLDIPAPDFTDVIGFQLLRSRVKADKTGTAIDADHSNREYDTFGDDIQGGYKWNVVATLLDGEAEFLDETPTANLAEPSVAVPVEQFVPPVGMRFLEVLDDFVLGAGHHKTEVRYCEAAEPEIWPANQFFHVHDDGGEITGLKVVGRAIYVFKTNRIEIWVNAGGPTQFVRRDIIEKGCIAPDSIVRADSLVFFLGDDGDFYLLAGSQPKNISITMTAELVELRDKEKCWGFEFRRERVVRFFYPTDGRCFTYDYTAEAWSEDGFYRDGEWKFFPVYAHLDNDGKSFVAGSNGWIYEMHEDFQTDDDEPIWTQRKFRVDLSGGRGEPARVKHIRFRMKNGLQKELMTDAAIWVAWAFDEETMATPQRLAMDADHFSFVEIRNLGYGRTLTLDIKEAGGPSFVVAGGVLTVVGVSS